MAMRHPKSIVLSGALSALYVMTVSHSSILVFNYSDGLYFTQQIQLERLLDTLVINEKG